MATSSPWSPIFKKQIAEDGPVPVTHREMKRRLMTIPEASRLVPQPATMGQAGEIFLLDMSEAYRAALIGPSNGQSDTARARR